MTKEENIELQKRINDTNENGVLDSVMIRLLTDLKTKHGEDIYFAVQDGELLALEHDYDAMLILERISINEA
jgi:hypothetical protein